MDAIVSHIWQSTLVAGGAAVLAWAFRHNRAEVRYRLWFAASMKFLIPLAAVSAILDALPWPRAGFSDNTAVAAVNAVFHSSAFGALPDAPVRAIAAVWLAGALIVLAGWMREWRRVAALVETADPVTSGPVHDALRRAERAAGLPASLRIAGCRRSIEPGLFGWWDPVLIWPLNLQPALQDAQIESILAHEVAHVRRRDNLLGALQMLVTAAFWFHPIVWWIGARLVHERERACDEQVLALGQNPSSYAAGILKTCEMCLASKLVNVPGISGGDLKERIGRIMRNEQGLPLGTARRAVLIAAVAAVLLVPALRPAGAAPAMPQAQDDDSSKVHRPGRDVKPPRLRKEVKPQYSERAKAEKIEGEVLMECVVKADGTVGDIKIVRSLDAELDQAAVDAARHWEFDPGTRNGKPVDVLVTIAMAFTLK